MQRNQRQQRGAEGRLPASAPLANPYVPFQLDNPPKYDARHGIIRGTLYPGLDLPFMGMVNKNELPVNIRTELQALGFAIQELALYLDTHRGDHEALELYQSYQEIYHKCMKEYAQNGRPLTHFGPSHGQCYQWIDDPWPWEYAANKEV